MAISNAHFQIVTFNSFLFQFLTKTAFPSKEGLRKRNGKAAHRETDNELRKKFGIVKDVRVHLNRINLLELTEDSGKASALNWKVITRTKTWDKVPKVLNLTMFIKNYSADIFYSGIIDRVRKLGLSLQSTFALLHSVIFHRL